MLTEEAYGTVEYLFVYRLLDDGAAFAFVPVSGATAEQSYLSYYQELKEFVRRKEAASRKQQSLEDRAALLGNCLGPMLSALMATQSEERICAQMGVFKSFGATSKDLQARRKSAVALRYPDFNFDKCKEATK
jgi:hypothetical protein